MKGSDAHLAPGAAVQWAAAPGPARPDTQLTYRADRLRSSGVAVPPKALGAAAPRCRAPPRSRPFRVPYRACRVARRSEVPAASRRNVPGPLRPFRFTGETEAVLCGTAVLVPPRPRAPDLPSQAGGSSVGHGRVAGKGCAGGKACRDTCLNRRRERASRPLADVPMSGYGLCILQQLMDGWGVTRYGGLFPESKAVRRARRRGGTRRAACSAPHLPRDGVGSGQSPVLVARWLGHEDPAFTPRTYGNGRERTRA